MELSATTLSGWGSAYYNVFGPKGQHLYGGNLPAGNSDTHQFCLPKDACSTVLMQSPGKMSKNGRLTSIHTYIRSSSSFFIPSCVLQMTFHFIKYFCFPQFPLGLYGREVSYDICGYHARVSDVVNVCVDANGVCTASVHPKKDDCLDFYMFDSVRMHF